MGSSSSIPVDKKIVIIGGGYGGIKLALHLMKNDANVTLIDAKDSMCHNVAAVRAIVQPDFVSKMYIDYATTFKGLFKKGMVVGIDTTAKTVILQDGEAIAYHVLIICTGCEGPFPAKAWDMSKDTAVAQYTEYAEKLKSAQRIAVVGGGAVGVEIAAEILTDFTDKQVSLFHAHEELLRTGLSDKFQKQVKTILGDRLKCKLVLGVKVTNLEDINTSSSGPCTLKTSDGESHEFDLVIKCTGLKVNSTAYKQGLENCMSEHGALKVTDSLQVEGHEDIFAIGDCNNVAESKLAVYADRQADHVYNNLKLKFNNKAMKPYKPDQMFFKIVISLGRNSGLGELQNGFIIPEMIVSNLKSKSMFYSKYWSLMNQKAPN